MANCKWKNFFCSGGTGTQTRAKTCQEPADGGQACPEQSRVEETKSCDAPACWEDWGQWSVSIVYLIDNNNGFLTSFKHVRHALSHAVALEPRLGPNLALPHQLEVWLAQKNPPRPKVLHVMLQLAGKSGVNGHHVLEGELIRKEQKNLEQRPFKSSLKMQLWSNWCQIKDKELHCSC